MPIKKGKSHGLEFGFTVHTTISKGFAEPSLRHVEIGGPRHTDAVACADGLEPSCTESARGRYVLTKIGCGMLTAHERERPRTDFTSPEEWSGIVLSLLHQSYGTSKRVALAAGCPATLPACVPRHGQPAHKDHGLGLVVSISSGVLLRA